MKACTRRGLWSALAGSLLFGGLITASAAATGALAETAASATTSSCASVNASLISGPNGPEGTAVSGSDGFVTSYATDMVRKYDGATCPTITTFTPTSGPVGTVVTIKGTNLLDASSVTFNGVSGTIKKDTASKIKVEVPSGATKGGIEVTTPGGNAESATKFKVTPPSSVAFVQADDTGTINGNTTSIGSGQSNQVLAHDTGIGHSVVLMIQTLGSKTNTVSSVSSGMGTFHFVNSYNDGADSEIWVCPDTTGAADSVTVTTRTNAWNAFAVEFNTRAIGFVNGGGQVFNPPYLGHQSWTVSPGVAGNVAVIGVDTLDAFETGPAAPWTYYNSGYWSFFNGTSAAWRVASSSSPLSASWVTDGGLSSSQGVVLEY